MILIRKLLLFLVAVAGLTTISSCKKQSRTGHKIESESFMPTIMFTAFDTIGSASTLFITTISPANSDSSLMLDIDNDGIDDFELNMTSWVSEYGSPSTPGSFLRHGSSLFGTTEDNKISSAEKISYTTSWPSYHSIINIEHDELINGYLNWNNNANLKIDFLAYPLYETKDYVYAGLKFKSGNKKHYGWLKYRQSGHHIEIAAYGYNRSNKRCIRAGQTD